MKQINVFALLLFVFSYAFATDYYVSNTGSNSNSGTSEEVPFKTLQYAVNLMEPGDVCYVRSGVYHEEIDLSGVTGSEGAPITIINYPGEKVILDGTVSIASDWTLDEGNVYKTTLTEDITQLFVDGKPMTLARFPNALAFSDDAFTGNVRRYKNWDEDGGGENGLAIDDPTRGASDGLAASGVSYEGCIGVLTFHNPENKLITQHSAGSDTFSYSPLFDKYGTRRLYFFEGGVGNAERVMLDIAQEWAYDEETNTLYLWADDGQDPSGRSVRGKTQTYAFTGDASTKYVTIDGLNFLGTAFSFDSSDNITIQNCELDYFAASKRAIGDLSRPRSCRFVGTETDWCESIKVYNCAFRYADGRALYANLTEDLVVENNYFHKIDYAVVAEITEYDGYNPVLTNTTMEFRGMDGLLYRRNTVDGAGAGQTVAYGKYGTTADEKLNYKPAIFEYNQHTACASRADDGSTIYMAHSEVVESIARYNWFYGNYERDFRYDGNNNTLQGVNGHLYRNISMDDGSRGGNIAGDGYRLKGSFHEIYNNVGVNARATLNVALDKGGNADTVTKNNVAQNFTDDPIPGTASNNYIGQNETVSVIDLLMDPTNFDFRPKPDAVQLIDQGAEVSITRFEGTSNEEVTSVTEGFVGNAPDIGAYEYGAASYWIPGRSTSQASNPVPIDEAVNVSVDADLMYLIGTDGVKGRVYMGSSADDLSFVVTNIEPNNITKLPSNFALEEDRTYYWRVDTRMEDGSTIEGEVWTFSTGSTIETVSLTDINVSPESASLDINETVQLSAELIPANASNRNYTWSSNNFSIATVDSNGLVSGIGEGTVIIKATNEDGDVIGESIITVSDNIILSTGTTITFDEEVFIIYPNPVMSIITITGAANSSIHLYNMSGGLVFSQDILNESENADLGLLAPGVYFAYIHTGTQVIVEKIVKE